MATPTQAFHFHSNFTGSSIDQNAGVIRSVSLITGGVPAIGHNLVIDEVTLSQVLTNSKSMGGQIPVYLDHGSGVPASAGYIDNVRRAGEKVVGDWNLLKTDPATPKLLEMAERMPKTFGLSLAFNGHGEKIAGGKSAARCTQVLSVDCVKHPAANPNGLFSAKVDKALVGQMDANTTTTEGAEPTLKDVLAAINDIGNRLESVENFQNEVTAHLEGELSEEGEVEGEESAEGAEGTEGTEGGEGTEGAPAAPATVSSSLSALQRRVIQLEAREVKKNRAEEEQEVAMQFAAIENDFIELQNANVGLLEQNQELQAKIEALELSAKSHRSPVALSHAPTKTMLFGKNAQPGSYEALVAARLVELQAENKGAPVIQLQGRAVRETNAAHPEAYAEYRNRGGQIELARK